MSIADTGQTFLAKRTETLKKNVPEYKVEKFKQKSIFQHLAQMSKKRVGTNRLKPHIKYKPLKGEDKAKEILRLMPKTPKKLRLSIHGRY